jgi:ketosteroid isomerase-like protein
MNDELLRQLIDERDITQVLKEYCRALDTMDLTIFDHIFTDDCEVEFGPDERLNSRGRDAVRSSLERLWRWARTSHHLSNVQICFDRPDSASSVSYVLAWHERPDGTSATIYGQYHDDLVRTGEGWRISKRVMYMNGCDAGFTVDIHPFPRRPPPEGWVAPQIDK